MHNIKLLEKEIENYCNNLSEEVFERFMNKLSVVEDPSVIRTKQLLSKYVDLKIKYKRLYKYHYSSDYFLNKQLQLNKQVLQARKEYYDSLSE